MTSNRFYRYRKEKNKFDIREEIRKYFLGSIFTVFWSSLVVIGGAVLILYFASINYTPEFDLKSSSTLVASIAISSLVFTLSFIVLIVAPGIVWRSVGNMDSTIYQRFRIERCFGDNFFGKLVVFLSDDDLGKMISIYAIPVVLLLASIFIGAAFRLSQFWMYFSLGATFGALVGAYYWFYRDFKDVGKLSFALLFSFLVITMNVSLTMKLVSKSPYNSEFWDVAAGFLFIILVLICNALFALRVRGVNSYVWMGSISMLVLVMMVTIFNSFLLVPEAAMRAFRYGNYDLKLLAVKGETCEAIKQRGTYDLNDSEFCLFEDVHVYSRVGTSYYFNYKHKSGNDQLIVKKTDVLYSVTNSCEKDVDVGNNYRCENDRPKQ